MTDQELVKKFWWGRGHTAQSRKRGKLHIRALLGLSGSGDYRAECSRGILLRRDIYPRNRLEEALEKEQFCKSCLKIAKVMVGDEG